MLNLNKILEPAKTIAIGGHVRPDGDCVGMCIRDRVYSVRVIAGAAVLSIICSFVGKLSMLIQTIPGPVIGGISFLSYGMIGASGIRILVDAQVDYGKSRNLTLTSVVSVSYTHLDVYKRQG